MPRSATQPAKLQGAKSVGPPVPGPDNMLTRVPNWLLGTLAVVILVLGLNAAATTALIVYRTYSPVIVWDQWVVVDSMMRTAGKFPALSMLWAQQNEHRIVLGRLACLADLHFFGGKNVSLLIEIYLVQLASALLFLWVFHHFRKASKAVLVTAAGLLLFCMLCPLQMENFVWGFQITFVFAEVAASFAFAAMVWYSAELATSKASRRVGLLLLSFFAAFVAECSLADGVLVWPMLLLLTLALRLPKWTQFLTAGVGASAIALYLRGYQAPSYHSRPSTSILHPLSVAKYVVTYFGSSWDSTLPSYKAWPTFSELVTVLAIAGSLASIAWLFVRSKAKPDPVRAFFAANILFALGGAVLTSLGRLDFGIGQAASSRYQVIALLFWASLAGLILASLAPMHSRSFLMLEVQIALLILMTSSISRFSGIEEGAKARQLTLSRAYAALAYEPDDPPDLNALKPLYPDPQLVPAWYAFLRSHKLGLDARELTQKNMLSSNLPDWGGYHVVAKTNCSGFFDAYQRLTPNKVQAQGWAWDIAARRPAQKIVLALPSGVVVGFGEVDTPRPDVQTRAQIPELVTGWTAEALAPHDSQLKAFAVLADSKSICPLENERRVP
jgi:hypothetical protein